MLEPPSLPLTSTGRSWRQDLGGGELVLCLLVPGNCKDASGGTTQKQVTAQRAGQTCPTMEWASFGNSQFWGHPAHSQSPAVDSGHDDDNNQN